MINPSLAMLLDAAELPHGAAANTMITGGDPVFPLRYRVVALGAAVLAANGIAAADLWRERTGTQQNVRVEGYAAAAALRSSHYLRVDGESPPSGSDKVTGMYRTRDGRWVYLHCNFFNLRDRNLNVLGVGTDKAAVAKAVAAWDGLALEEALFEAEGCGALIRTEAEWNALPQREAVARLPLLEIIKIGDAPPEALQPGARPLSGVRVLDLTRVLAGPTCARSLAEHGADVLRINRRGMADSGMVDFDTGLGKLSTYLDFQDPAQAATLRELVRTADVFSQAYRPGALANHGLSPDALAALRPGLVMVSLSAWGREGPWRNRRGYDTVVQAVNGMADCPDTDRPAFLPVAAQDYIAGYLMSFGAMVALGRRTREGGTWLVRVSLARIGHWIREHGLLERTQYERATSELPTDVLSSLLMESESPIGRLTHLRPAVQLSETPAHWSRTAVPLGWHSAQWPERQST